MGAGETKMRIRSVFVASDLSDASEEAIKIGHRWAERNVARLTVGFVVPKLVTTNPFFPQAAQTDTINLIEAERRSTEELADTVARVTGRAPEDFRIVVTSGTPVSGILQLVREAGADLIVVGPDAADNASVAERIARVAPCAVLIARKSPSVSGDRIGPVVAGTDLSDPSFGAVRAAFDVAPNEPRKITIVHAIETPPPSHEKIWSLLGQRPPPVENKVPAARARIHSWLETTGRSISDGLEVVVVESDAARALIDFAMARSAELIVVGTRGWTSEADLPLGSVAEVVVRTAPCSVLVARL